MSDPGACPRCFVFWDSHDAEACAAEVDREVALRQQVAALTEMLAESQRVASDQLAELRQTHTADRDRLLMQVAALTEREATWILARDRLMDERNKLIAECRALTEENARLRARAIVAEQHKTLELLSKGSAVEQLEMKLREQLAEAEIRAEKAEAALSRLTAGETPKPRRSEMELDEALFCGAAGETPEPGVETLDCGSQNELCLSQDYGLGTCKRHGGETPEPPAPKEPNPCKVCGTFLWGDTRPCWNCARTPPPTGAGE